MMLDVDGPRFEIGGKALEHDFERLSAEVG